MLQNRIAQERYDEREQGSKGQIFCGGLGGALLCPRVRLGGSAGGGGRGPEGRGVLPDSPGHCRGSAGGVRGPCGSPELHL